MIVPLTASRVAAVSDIHGNLPTLNAVLSEIEREGVDLIVCCGDVAAGPFPRQTLDRLKEITIPIAYVRGNADREMVERFDQSIASRNSSDQDGPPDPVLAWTVGQIDRSHRDMLAGFVEGVLLSIIGLGQIRVCHGSPRSDEEIVTKITAESRLQPMLVNVAELSVMVGHTHVQFDRQVGGRRWLNPGGVGMPYEGRPGAYWAIIGAEVEFRRTEYDGVAAAVRIRATGYPDAEDFATGNVLNPPNPYETSAYFEALANDRVRCA